MQRIFVVVAICMNISVVLLKGRKCYYFTQFTRFPVDSLVLTLQFHVFFIAERCSFNLCAGLTLNASLFWLPNHQIGISDDSIRLYYLVYVWNWEKRCKWLKHIKRLRSHFQSHMRDGTSITIGRF